MVLVHVTRARFGALLPRLILALGSFVLSLEMGTLLFLSGLRPLRLRCFPALLRPLGSARLLRVFELLREFFLRAPGEVLCRLPSPIGLLVEKALRLKVPF